MEGDREAGGAANDALWNVSVSARYVFISTALVKNPGGEVVKKTAICRRLYPKPKTKEERRAFRSIKREVRAEAILRDRQMPKPAPVAARVLQALQDSQRRLRQKLESCPSELKSVASSVDDGQQVKPTDSENDTSKNSEPCSNTTHTG